MVLNVGRGPPLPDCTVAALPTSVKVMPDGSVLSVSVVAVEPVSRTLPTVPVTVLPVNAMRSVSARLITSLPEPLILLSANARSTLRPPVCV